MNEELEKKNEATEPEELPKEPTAAPEEKSRKEEKKEASKKEYARLHKEAESLQREMEKSRKELEELKEQAAAQNDRYLRMMAEYDNFRKRAANEKDGIYSNACADVLKEILPVIDALEMAVKFGGEGGQILKGVEMTIAKFKEALDKLGVTEIEAKTFDPNFHNAVMHVEDENFKENEIVEVFQKGYKKGDKIIRYAMVKVAN